MKNSLRLFVSLVAVYFACGLTSAFAGEEAHGFTVVTTFDYGAGNSTYPYGINNTGEIAGYYVDASNVTRGFTRMNNGKLSKPIVEPGDTGNFTVVYCINKLRELDGSFLNTADNTIHGFFLNGHSYTQYDFPNAAVTELLALNDAGDFAGTGFDSTLLVYQAIVSIGGTTSVINLPANTQAGAHGMNNSNEVVGTYVDSSSVTHGFLRKANGSVVAPLDYPGSTNTTLQGISDKGLIVGRYTDGSGVLHGLLLKLPHSFFVYDYPGATATSFNDINTKGEISARYNDGEGVAHGLIVQFK
jgi:hypothetical protein